MQPLARLRFAATEPISSEEVDDFLDVAPFRTHVVYDFPQVPVQQLWDVVSSDRMWSWLPTVWGCRYPVGEEVAAGTVRDFQMFVHHWLIYAQREQILIWEPGERLVYTATDATLPFFGSWCEKYAVEPGPGGGSRLRWTMGVKPRFLGWLPLRFLSPLFRQIYRFGLRGVVREVGTGLDGVAETRVGR